jgi:hypothetical protein
VVEGPWAWRNWLADATEPAERVEVMLYTDAHVTGELRSLGPYELLNTVPMSAGEMAPTIVLRASLREPQRGLETPEGGFESAEEVETDTSRYHGGDLFDELAALISLALGIRCHSGGLTRRWSFERGPEDDPLRLPFEYDHRPPYYPPVPHRGEPIPSLMRSVVLGDAVDSLNAYPMLEARVATAVLRAARLYQQAVWISRTDPSVAWIQLVSALEVAAESWLSEELDPEARLQRHWPSLAQHLKNLPSEKRAAIATVLAPLMRSRRRCLDFMGKFAAEPPVDRPPDAFKINWTHIEKALATIYDYRSVALHAGTPFPAPMCEPPHDIDGHALEIPVGLATATADAVWRAADTPMLLSTFERMARSALVKWWMASSIGT